MRTNRNSQTAALNGSHDDVQKPSGKITDVTTRAAAASGGKWKHSIAKDSSEGELDHIRIAGIVESVIAVGRQRAAQLELLRIALISEDEQNALRLARELCGVSDEEGHRTDTRVH